MNGAPVKKVLAGIAGVAGLANANFLLAPFVGARIDLTKGVISELSVPGEPGAVWFRLGDGGAGVLSVVLAVLLRRRRFSAVCLAVFGVGTFISALVPLTCAPSLGVCPASAAGPELVHDGVSVVATAAAVAGSLELAWRARGPWRWPAIAAAAVSAGCGALGVLSFATGGGGGGGASQRWQVLAVSAWIVLETLARRGTSRTPQVPPPV